MEVVRDCMQNPVVLRKDSWEIEERESNLAQRWKLHSSMKGPDQEAEADEMGGWLRY
jgi:hypothetical protein